MNNQAAADIVIFGGGVAGLWLLNRLRQTGLSVILFESNALGGGQTHKAQGIIHGGIKYALQGILTKEAQVMADMPTHWKQCLAGQGEIDLSHVPVLSAQHYLWAPNKFTSKLTGFLAGSTLRSKVALLDKAQYPTVFQHAAFKGDVFSLDEIVIDVQALVRELVRLNQDAVFKIEPICEEALQFDEKGQLLSATVYMAGKPVTVSAQQFIFTAGTGNEVILKSFHAETLAMQRRPLHMVLVKTPFDLPLYAHCLGLGPRPRMTITTHYTQDGSAVWYLGGQLAEDGVKRSAHEQIRAAQQELQQLFPWLDFSRAEFATFMIDRAEPKQRSGLMPDSVFAKSVNNIIIAWPTKLALAPKLAEEIMQQILPLNLTHHYSDIRALRAWPMPPLARAVWEEAFCKSVA